MFYSDQFAQENVVVSDGAKATPQTAQKTLETSNLENLIPQNISSNKRAVIERLVSLYQANLPRQ